jgi:hypothetical protein
MKSRTWIFLAMLTTTSLTSAQTQRQRERLFIEGYPGEVNAIRSQGHLFVDVQDVARITNGSINFENNRIILVIPARDGTQPADDAAKTSFSPAFRRAAIEAMASLREWGGMLQVVVQNGYPVGKGTAGNTIRAYQGRAADSIASAAAAASTDSDSRGLELLRNEFNNMQKWSEAFVNARNSLSAANLSVSENPLDNDADAQKIIACGQLLAQMFAAGSFQDDATCH